MTRVVRYPERRPQRGSLRPGEPQKLLDDRAQQSVQPREGQVVLGLGAGHAQHPHVAGVLGGVFE